MASEDIVADPNSTVGSTLIDASRHRRSMGLVDSSFYIIGVGASAGGLEAIRQLIGQAGAGFPHTFVIIQHLSPDHESMMVEILARETDLSVEQVKDDSPVEPGKVYLIPPKSNIVIQGTIDDTQPDIDVEQTRNPTGLRFSLISSLPRPQLNLPIDLFFHSLAEAANDRAIGIVLSGTGSDGSRGLRSIKDRDGFVIVQEPETAEFDGMPTSAMSTMIVDLVATPDSMIAEVQRYILLREGGAYDIDRLFKGNEASFGAIIEKVSEAAAIDFSQYKPPTLKRRLARRLGLTDNTTLQEYLEYVSDNPQEISILHREFLIGVTSFFRDLPAWNAIRERIAPKLFTEGDSSEPIKVWSVGCSTGEEAYSIALLLEEYRVSNKIERDFRVFASDVNADAIQSAKSGVFPSSVFDEIPERYQNEKYTLYHGGVFKIATAIKNKIIFREHNVLDESPYINTDLIICRNFLIYLGAAMQAKAVSLFSFSLRNGGYLFLGAAENMSHRTTRFHDEVPALRIFKNSNSGDNAVGMNITLGSSKPPVPELRPRLRRLGARQAERASTVLGETLSSVLGFVDSGVFVIDIAGNITETFGDYRSFVEFPDEAFTANIFDLVHDRLKTTLSMLLRGTETDLKAVARGVKCTYENRIEEIDVFVERNSFDEVTPIFNVMLKKNQEMKTLTNLGDDLRENLSDAEGIYVAKLETEVEALRDMLTLLNEDLGISNEELQTANEELTVSNEELQASNEEMQSINEELHSVNGENAEKIALLEAANADIDDLLSTAEVAIVLLENTLTIRRFNDAFLKYVDLNEGDYGRKISSFASRFEQPGLASLLEDTQTVLANNSKVERELRLDDGSWVLARTRPLQHVHSQESPGVAITILDITELKKLRTDPPNRK